MHHCSAALLPPPPPNETVLQLLYYPAAVWPSILCLFCIYLYFVNRMSVFAFWKSPTILTAALLNCCLTFKHACHLRSADPQCDPYLILRMRLLSRILNFEMSTLYTQHIWEGKLKSQTLLTFKHACCPGSPDPDSSLPAAYIHKHSQIQIHPWTLANINTSVKTEALTCTIVHLSPGNCKYW